MGKNIKEFPLRTRSKFMMVGLFSFVGGPMLYAAYLNYNVGELLFAGLMVLLFLLWAVVIIVANGYKIKLTETAIHRQGLISPSIINFADVKAINFGSTWSNFYIASEDKKIYFGKDFKDYDHILREIVNNVRTIRDIAEVDFLGDPENIQEYTSTAHQEN